jgi:hypothetical protein
MLISEWWIGEHLEGIGRGLILKYFLAFTWMDWVKPWRNLSQDSQSSSWDLYSWPPEYEAAVLATRQWRSVPILNYCSRLVKRWDAYDVIITCFRAPARRTKISCISRGKFRLRYLADFYSSFSFLFITPSLYQIVMYCMHVFIKNKTRDM